MYGAGDSTVPYHGALGFTTAADDGDTSRDAPQPQEVAVTNLDPLGISGPIVWQAETDAHWIRLEPPAGRTPRSGFG